MQGLNRLGIYCLNTKPVLVNRLFLIKVLSTSSPWTFSWTTTTLNSNDAGFCRNTSRLLDCFKVNNIVDLPDSLSRTFCTVSEKQSCWKCGAILQTTPAFFCPDCEVVQFPDDRATYFDIMDCDKSYTVDTQKLQQRYLHLQRSLHPDNFSLKTKKEKECSESQSSLVNKAYRTLLRPLSRGLYLLELGGMCLEEGGTDIGDTDSEFLLEIMELNERLAETQHNEEVDSIGLLIQGRLQDLNEQIKASFHKGDLQSAKTLLSQMKYFVNIEEKVKERLSELL